MRPAYQAISRSLSRPSSPAAARRVQVVRGRKTAGWRCRFRSKQTVTAWAARERRTDSKRHFFLRSVMKKSLSGVSARGAAQSAASERPRKGVALRQGLISKRCWFRRQAAHFTRSLSSPWYSHSLLSSSSAIFSCSYEEGGRSYSARAGAHRIMMRARGSDWQRQRR